MSYSSVGHEFKVNRNAVSLNRNAPKTRLVRGELTKMRPEAYGNLTLCFHQKQWLSLH